jgi:DNA-binding CsgD family transcriptional regulator
MKISGFIVISDSYLIRKGVLSVLNRIQGVRVLKEFGSDDSFVSYLGNHPVDFILIGQTEFDRNEHLFISNPGLLDKTILLEGPPQNKRTIIRSGPEPSSSILLADDKETILRKIRKLLNQQEDRGPDAPSMELSPREQTIVKLISMGLTNRQIAEKLFLSTHTVMTHRKNINSKLGIKSVSGLIIYAIVNNIITLEEVGSNATG